MSSWSSNSALLHLDTNLVQIDVQTCASNPVFEWKKFLHHVEITLHSQLKASFVLVKVKASRIYNSICWGVPVREDTYHGLSVK